MTVILAEFTTVLADMSDFTLINIFAVVVIASAGVAAAVALRK